MPDSGHPAPPAPAGAESSLTPLFVAIVLVEAVTIALLYWFSRHFS